jgi:hypothetical protein
MEQMPKCGVKRAEPFHTMRHCRRRGLRRETSRRGDARALAARTGRPAEGGVGQSSFQWEVLVDAGSARNYSAPCAAAAPASCPLTPSRACFGRVNPLPNLAPSWNVAPTQDAAVVRRNPETGERHLDLLKWGHCRNGRRNPLRAAIKAHSETAAKPGMHSVAALRCRPRVFTGINLPLPAASKLRHTASLPRAEPGWQGRGRTNAAIPCELA